LLRLPSFRYHRPSSLEEALSLLAEHGREAMAVAGGTDLIPNMKHRLFEPAHLVALKGLPELRGIRESDGHLEVGAAETLSAVAADPMVRRWFPSLAEAAGHVAGPQLRNAGTLGGNLCLDTRCTYYNQTRFWREALGFCLKKDGDVCHVTRVGKKCVAAHSADTPPVLMTLDADLEVVGPSGACWVRVADFFRADGIHNTRLKSGELVSRVRIPLPREGTRTGYAKLRQRKAIDFPLLTIAAAARTDAEGRVVELRGVVTALGARPKELSGWQEAAEGQRLSEGLVEALAERAHAQCHPLENITVDAEWRRAMVPVYVRKALSAMLDGRPAS
jgi:4-hydroxybenzoyl-CoA reductase subunit beta